MADRPISQMHAAMQVGKWLAADLLSTLIFLALYAVLGNIFLATGVAIAVSVSQIAYRKLRGAPIEPLQWLSLILVIVFGGATLITRNPVFVMLKPTLIYAAIGTVMLKRGWMNRYVPPDVREYSAEITTVFGYLWAALMFATGAANLAFAAVANPVVWAVFIGAFPIASKIVLAVIQFLVIGRVVRRRIRATRADRRDTVTSQIRPKPLLGPLP